jgi:hypothetical protein
MTVTGVEINKMETRGLAMGKTKQKENQLQ